MGRPVREAVEVTETEEGAANDGPLAGIRVLDLTKVVMGPYATQTLGDMGADVIVIEDKAGDTNRAMGPGPVRGQSGVSLNLMRNKRSIALDLKHPECRSVALDLAAQSDIVITNLRPGPLARLGLDYDDIRAVRNDVIFCQAIGHPTDSPNADAPAYDDVIQTGSGIGDLFLQQGHEPSLAPTLIADKVAGLMIVNAVLAALHHRTVTGRGQRIEIPMIDVIRSFVLVEHGSGAIPEPPVGSAGYPRILTPNRRPQQTADGWVHVFPYTRANYERLFEENGSGDLFDEELMGTRRARMQNADAIYVEVSKVIRTNTTEHWLEFCAANDIPVSPMTTMQEIVDELPLDDHPHVGRYRQVPIGTRFADSPGSIRRHAPMLGEHGEEILTELGWSQDRIAALAESDAIYGLDG